MTVRLAPWLALAAVALAYAPSLRNGFVYDDHEVILQQRAPRTLGELARSFAEPHGLPQSQLPYYRPTTRASLLAQKALHGDDARLFHAANVALMGAVALAAYALLRAPRLGLAPGAAAWGAAAFALHPVASECVLPIASGRESAMPALFALLTVAAWLRGGRAGRGAALAAFSAALWSKEQAIVVPPLLALADALGLAPGAPSRRAGAWLRRHLPFLAVLVAFLVVREAVLAPLLAQQPRQSPFAALAADPLGPLRSLLYLIQSVFAPSPRLVYEPAFHDWLAPARAAAGTLVFLAVAAAALRLPPHPDEVAPRAVPLFWLGWMPIAMALNANLLPLEVAYAERYLFLASLGAVALCALAARRAAHRLGRSRAATAIGVAALLGLALLTQGRIPSYRDEIAFTRQWAATSPRHGNAHASLGAALARAGHEAEAVAALREAVRLEPRLASAHYNLGVLLAGRGDLDGAIAAFSEALRHAPRDADAHHALGLLRARRGEREAARAHLREALRLRPGFADAAEALRALDEAAP